MSEENVVKRKVNPALLLRGAQEAEKRKPVVETTEFGSAARGDWRKTVNSEEALGKLVTSPVVASTPVAPPTVSPVIPESRTVIQNPMLSKDADDEATALLVQKAKLKSAVAPVESEPVDSSVDSPTLIAPEPVKRRVASRFSLLDDEADMVDSDDTDVSDASVEVSAVSVRRRNEVELEGEELSPELSTTAQGRVVRPNFLSVNERGTSAKPFTAVANPKPRHAYDNKTAAHVEVEEWTEDTSSDTSIGLGAEKDDSYVAPQYARGFHLTERDIIIMKFLARYRYAYPDQLARLVDTTPRSIASRMATLEKRGFVHKQAITERQYLWMTRKAGNLIVDISFGEIKKGTVSYATIAHTIGLANLGVELEREAGGKDILGERDDPDDVPFENRYKLGLWGNPDGKTFGEMTVTEREIRQGQMRWRGGRSTAEMRETVNFAMVSLEEGDEAQETLEGNEGLFVVYSEGGEHIPDLVVARERDENGNPQHLAIELELTGKPAPQWKRILRWYRDFAPQYSKVIYFTHKRSIATALRKADEEVGLGDRLVIRKYIPNSGNRMPFWG
jgi:hypothetical protein